MDLQLTGKLALVTGSTAGIGLAICSALAGEGATVIINGRSEDRVAAALAKVLRKHPRAKVEALVGDLSKAETAEQATGRFADLDILINNLGHYEPKPFEEISDEDWAAIIETNFMSGVRLSRHYLPRMKARNWGRIIFISSESAINIPAEMIHYGVTKTMQLALARGLAETTAGTEVTVNSILAGPTRSEGVEVSSNKRRCLDTPIRLWSRRSFSKLFVPVLSSGASQPQTRLQPSWHSSPARFRPRLTGRRCASRAESYARLSDERSDRRPFFHGRKRMCACLAIDTGGSFLVCSMVRLSIALTTTSWRGGKRSKTSVSSCGRLADSSPDE